MITLNIRTSTTRRTVTADIIDTPRSVFDSLGITTDGTAVNLDGNMLGESKLGKTFEELGLEDGETYNMNSIVKADGAARFAIAGDAYVITSDLCKGQVELVKKWRPDALKVKDKDGNDVFAVSYVEGHPCISSKGVTFGGVSHDGNENLTITGDIPADTTDVKAFLADLVAPICDGLNAIESTVPAVAAEIETAHNELVASISVCD